jgi:hypothetical protein
MVSWQFWRGTMVGEPNTHSKESGVNTPLSTDVLSHSLWNQNNP